jgi:hypothetical protein
MGSNCAFERTGTSSAKARGRRGGQFAPAARWQRLRPAAQRGR